MCSKMTLLCCLTLAFLFFSAQACNYESCQGCGNRCSVIVCDTSFDCESMNCFLGVCQSPYIPYIPEDKPSQPANTSSGQASTDDNHNGMIFLSVIIIILLVIIIIIATYIKYQRRQRINRMLREHDQTKQKLR